MPEKLALLGGKPVIERSFTPYRSHGPEEKAAALAVIESGVLSRFFGSWCEDFLGGPRVREFESRWSKWFGVPHSVTVNSATSGLIAALGAAGVAPGDEVIVSPLTMSATATAIVVWNGIPVFADVEPDTFTLDPRAVEALITERTAAILVTDIFGHAGNLDALADIARRHGIVLIEDAAQAPGALYRGRYAGTVADIGIYSLNYHKHIHTGEGGVCVTRDPVLAERMQMIRNHAEGVVGPKGVADISNMIGFNFRLGEIEAAMGIAQLDRLAGLVAGRQDVARRLDDGLGDLPGLRVPVVADECTHAYYVYPLLLDRARVPVPKARLVEALRAEGVQGLAPAFANLHLLPMYQRRIAYGNGGYPWSAGAQVSYAKGICPVVEEMRDHTLFGLQVCMFQFDREETDLTIAAFRKVWAHLEALA